MGCFRSPLITRQDRIIRLDVLLPDTPRGKCFDNNFDTRENIELIWEQSNAAEVLDTYLQSQVRAYEDWPSNLFMSIFPKASPSSFSYLQKNDKCSTDKTCEDFEEAGWPGAFYIFTPLDNFNKFLNQFEEHLGYLRDDLASSIDKMLKGLNIEEALKLKEKINFFKLASSLIGIGSEFESNPALGQLMGVTGSLMELAGEQLASKEEARDIKSVRIDVEVMVKDTIDVYRSWIADIRFDVYGRKPSQDDGRHETYTIFNETSRRTPSNSSNPSRPRALGAG